MMAGAGGAMRARGGARQPSGFNNSVRGPACTISLTHSRARGADDGGRRRRDASYGVARDSHPVSRGGRGGDNSVRGLLWHRSLSGGEPVDSDKHTRSTGVVPDLRQQLVRRCVWQWTVAGGRRPWFVGADLSPRNFGAAPAMMVPRRRGATNTTLAATQRHPCRSGMVTADCARSRSRPESVLASGTQKDRRKIPASTISLTHSRARGADDGGRRRRDASYGVARDSHPVSTIR